MKLLRFVVLPTALSVGASASAAEIVYTLESFAEGAIGGQSFIGVVTVEGRADTLSQQPCANNGTIVAGCFRVANDSLSIYIDGLGTYDVLGPSISFVNNSANIFGFSQLTETVNTFAFVNIAQGPSIPAPTTVFATYDGISDLGPVGTNARFNMFFAPGFSTSGGTVIFNPSVQTRDAFFTARLVNGAVPEPTTWALMLLGFGFVGAAMRTRPQVRVASIIYD